MIITVTERAAKKIQRHLTQRGKGLGIRIGVKTTGCSGLAYVLEYVDSMRSDDYRVECNGCWLFVDPKSCVYIQGLEIDFVRNGLNEGFEFRNPNSKGECGCGESFRI
jgi:iron-sulfur cluster assembly protein